MLNKNKFPLKRNFYAITKHPRYNKKRNLGVQSPPRSKLKMATKKNLPKMSDAAQEIFETFSNLEAHDRFAFVLHANDFNRANASTSSRDITFEVGQQVRIIGGNAKYYGKVGTISDTRRTRVFVQLKDVEKPQYLFASEVVSLESVENMVDEQVLEQTG